MQSKYLFLSTVLLFLSCNQAHSQTPFSARINGDFEEWTVESSLAEDAFLVAPTYKGTLAGWYPHLTTTGTDGLTSGSRALLLSDWYGTGEDHLATFVYGSDPFVTGIPIDSGTIINFSLDYQFIRGDESDNSPLGGSVTMVIYRRGDFGGVDTVGVGIAQLLGDVDDIQNVVAPIRYDDDTNLVDLYSSIEIKLQAAVVDRPLHCPNCVNLIVDNIKFNFTGDLTSNNNDDILENKFRVFPNPVRDLLTIISPSEYRGRMLLVHQTGQLLRKFILPDGIKAEISTEGLPAGVIYVINDRGELIQQLIKE